MTNFETSNQDQANLYDTPIHRPYGEEVDPRALLAHKLEIMSQGIDPDEIEDYMFLRIAKNFVLEEQLHPALAFAQRVKDPVPRRSAIRAFDSVIHDAPTSTLPVITPDMTDYSGVMERWTYSVNRVAFYGFNMRAAGRACLDELVDSEAVWTGVPKPLRFEVLATAAAVASSPMDHELSSLAIDYLALKKKQFSSIGVDIVRQSLAKYVTFGTEENKPQHHVTGGGDLTAAEAHPIVEKLIQENKEYTAENVVRLVQNGREAVDVFRHQPWSNMDKYEVELLVTAQQDHSMPLRWRMDLLDEYLVRGYISFKNHSAIYDSYRKIRDEYAKGKKYAPVGP